MLATVPTNRPTLIGLAAVCLLWSPLGCFAKDELTIQVHAGDHHRIGSLISVRLPESFSVEGPFSLRRLDGDAEIPCQVVVSEGPRLIWILREPLPARQVRQYRLHRQNSAPDSQFPQVRVLHDGKTIRVRVAGQPVLAYNVGVVQSADRKAAFYDRSGYIHPLYNPRGQVITDDFAPDHPHQHGLMFPWTNTTFEGRQINFWDQKEGLGKIEHVALLSRHEGPVCGEFTVLLRHHDATDPDRLRPVLEETWRVRVYNFVDYFLFDFRSDQRCVGSPLQINQYYYGGFAIRGHRNWLTPGQGDFLTSEGKNRRDGDQSRPRWCDIYGLIDGQTSGATIFCHPENFRFPQPVRLHPNKPYFCFSVMSLGEFTLQAGNPYVSRYRVCAHNNRMDREFAARLWYDFAQPPAVTVE